MKSGFMLVQIGTSTPTPVEKKLRFLMKTFQDFLHIMVFSGNQTVRGPNESFGAASKGFKRHQTMSKGLIKRNDQSFKK